MSNLGKTVIFGGPSVDKKLKKRFPEFTFKSPAQQGDIYQLVEACNVDQIVLLDGYYKTVPAVWHKEIIYALDNNIRVAGAASLGALRAVELESFGMRGYGRIFKWYQTGILTRDPDVAVLHTDASDDYRTLTIPVVNVLATLKDSRRKIDDSVIIRAIKITRSVFFEHRTMAVLLKVISCSTLDDKDKSDVLHAIQEEYIDQKYNDSIYALESLNSESPRISMQKMTQPDILNKTLYWDALVVNDSYIDPHSSGLLLTKQALLAFQLLDRPSEFMRMRDKVQNIELCQWIASLYEIKSDPEMIDQMRKELCQSFKLKEAELEEWMNKKGLSLNELDEYLNSLAIMREVSERLRYRSPMCPFNRLHYNMLSLSTAGEDTVRAFKKFESTLSMETISAIDELPYTLDSFPKEALDVINVYRKELFLGESLSSIGTLTAMPISYVLTLARLYGYFKQIMYKLFTKFFNAIS
jgi:hypothetical protein